MSRQYSTYCKVYRTHPSWSCRQLRTSNEACVCWMSRSHATLLYILSIQLHDVHERMNLEHTNFSAGPSGHASHIIKSHLEVSTMGITSFQEVTKVALWRVPVDLLDFKNVLDHKYHLRKSPGYYRRAQGELARRKLGCPSQHWRTNFDDKVIGRWRFQLFESETRRSRCGGGVIRHIQYIPPSPRQHAFIQHLLSQSDRPRCSLAYQVHLSKLRPLFAIKLTQQSLLGPPIRI